jgi:hypothetical protein
MEIISFLVYKNLFGMDSHLCLPPCVMVYELSVLPSFFFVAFISILATKLAYNLLKRNARPLQYPPGPKPKFLIGNALDFPKDVGQVFAEWGKKYNSVV